MNLPKAIQIGELNLKEGGKKMPPDVAAALSLLVEAAKLIDYCRSGEYNPPYELLPGEEIV